MASTLRTSLDSDRVLTVTLDLPNKPVNILSTVVFNELDDVLATIQLDQPRGVIFTSGKPRAFVAGADLIEMRGMSRPQLNDYLSLGQRIFARMSRLSMPVVAAINGDALGGGLELALGCGFRIVADDRAITIGLPETKLGLVPGFGGTIRLPRLIGVEQALSLMTSGNPVPPREALRLGLVDEVAPRDALLAAAKRLALSRPKDHPNARPDRSNQASPQERNHLLDQAEYDAETRSQGRYPAAVRVVNVVRTGYEHGVDAALAAERKALTELMEGPTAQSLIRLFFMRQSAKKSAGSQAGLNASSAQPPPPVKYAAVLGGGTMGSGIAHALIRAGIETQLIEVNPDLATAGAERVKQILAGDLSSDRIDESESRRATELLRPAADWTTIQQADIVIEAVVEDINVKREIFARLDREARPDAVLASNTSSISLTQMAAATSRPARVVGIHFFNPVPKMPLVEIIRAQQSQPPALATAVALATRLAKVPVVANDSPGFIVNGLLIPYLCEAVRLVSEGMGVEAIDRALVEWGWPMGPLTLMDHIGLDVCVGIVRAMQPSRPDRVSLPRGLTEAVKQGVLGRKSGRGFYLYDSTSKKGTVNQELIAPLLSSAPPKTIDAEKVQWRLMLMMANEAARVLEQRVASSAEAIDLSVLLGLGMGQFRGGLMRWCDSVGLADVVTRLRELANTLGHRFEPSPLLVELARSNRPLSDYHR